MNATTVKDEVKIVPTAKTIPMRNVSCTTICKNLASIGARREPENTPREERSIKTSVFLCMKSFSTRKLKNLRR